MEYQNNQQLMTDKAFSRLIAVPIIGMIICIVSLCSVTWAWFSGGAVSNSNTLESGCFDLDLSIVREGVEPSTVTPVKDDASGYWQCTLGEAGDYTITLSTANASTASKGYCVITVVGSQYVTPPLYKTSDAMQPTDAFTLTITTDTADTRVFFEPRWGISSAETIPSGYRITIETIQLMPE